MHEGEFSLQYKITDFGLARVMETSKAYAYTRCGTAIYMSKEAHEGRYSFGADIWAAGCVLYEMCTLKRAFDFDTTKKAIRAIVDGKIPKLPKGSPNGESWKDLSHLCTALHCNRKIKCFNVLIVFYVDNHADQLGSIIFVLLNVFRLQDDAPETKRKKLMH